MHQGRTLCPRQLEGIPTSFEEQGYLIARRRFMPLKTRLRLAPEVIIVTNNERKPRRSRVLPS